VANILLNSKTKTFGGQKRNLGLKTDRLSLHGRNRDETFNVTAEKVKCGETTVEKSMWEGRFLHWQIVIASRRGRGKTPISRGRVEWRKRLK